MGEVKFLEEQNASIEGIKGFPSNFPKKRRFLINRRGKSPPSTIRKGASPFLTYPLRQNYY
jgi:hypothetical protein